MSNLLITEYMLGEPNTKEAYIMTTLKSVRPGNTVTVSKINGMQAVKRHIMDMGITKGTVITVKKTAPLGDPLELGIRGYTLAIRKDDAAMIEVE